MIKAIVFDCFGVIITDALQALCDELRVKDPAAADQVRDIIQAANRGMLDPAESRPQIAALLGLSLEDLMQAIRSREVKDVELLAYIAELRRSYKTAMLSNITRGGLQRRFAEGELEKYFDVVVASGDIGYAKPEPAAYQITADRLGVRCDECIFVDDREVFVEAARGVGMQALLYEGFGAFKDELARLLGDSR